MMKFLVLALAALIVVSGAAFAANCTDGTPYGKSGTGSCSSKSPGMYCTGNYQSPTLQPYTNLCKCELFPGWVTQGSGEEATCIQAKCSDGTQTGQCSSTKPKQCSNGVLIDNSTACGCPAGKRVAAGGVFCESVPCTYNGETVREGECSVKKVKKCSGGQMVDAASTCGCPPGQTRVGEKCSVTCTDGTLDGECSPTKPKECTSGALIDNAQKCGCPPGQSAVGRNCAEPAFGGIGGADLFPPAAGPNDSGQGTASGPSALSCCCLPTALIGVVAGFAVFRKKD